MSQALDRFRAAVLADEALQLELAPLYDPHAFEQAVLAAAAARGIPLDARDLEEVRLNRRAPPPGAQAWPPRHWLPGSAQDGSVDWLHFAGRPLKAPFYAQDRDRANALPFNRLFGYRTPLASLAGGQAEGGQAPDGLIFHMSRCGSTLVAQMLAAVSANVVVSEAEPLDAVVQLRALDPEVSFDWQVEALRGMAFALGRHRSASSRRCYIKLDCWHTIALPLFRAAFPDTPWIFVYRDPVEVLASLARMPGRQVVPGLVQPDFLGIPSEHARVGTDYSARVLARICDAVLEHWHLGSGLLVDYRELPGAVASRILPHFGAQPAAAERAVMTAAAGHDAKEPGNRFTPDGKAKRAEADDATRAAAERHLGPVFARLEALRATTMQP